MIKRVMIAIALLLPVGTLPSVAASPACAVLAALPVALQTEVAAASAEPVAGSALEWRLDDAQIAAAIDAQSGPKSKWDDLSKTTKIWFIVGGAVIALIVISALD